MSGMGEDSSYQGNRKKKPDNHRGHFNKDVTPGSELWIDGLICAFEFVRGGKKTVRPRSYSKNLSTHQLDGENIKKQPLTYEGTKASTQRLKGNNLTDSPPLIQGTHEIGSMADNLDRENSKSDRFHTIERFEGSHWVPIGWARISELVQIVQGDAGWSASNIDLMDDEDDLAVADLVAPYWEHPAGPVWWCHVAAGHLFVDSWLKNAPWLHPAISIALRDESRLISDRMKHLLYEVPVRVAGGLLFELLGQSVGDPYVDEDDIPVVLRSWQAQNFLITVLHTKGFAKNINILGITEVQELLIAGGYTTPRSIHEVIAHLACRLARWDDRLFRKSIFGAADEVELKFMNRGNHEDLYLFGIILNQETRRLSRQPNKTKHVIAGAMLPTVEAVHAFSTIVGLAGKRHKYREMLVGRLATVIRVKWSLHAREEIVFELLQHLRGNATKTLLEGIRKSTREMIEEQEAVRGRLFTIQDVMQSTVRAWLQDKSLRVTHNLTVFGGCGLVLSIITGLFGINVDGIPGAASTPYAFALFAVLLSFLGIVLIAVGLLYLGMKKPVSEEQVEVRKLELQQLVKMFQHEAESHAQVRQPVSRHNLPPTAADKFLTEADYVLIH